MKWPILTQKYTTPPIQKTDGLLTTFNKEKRDALKQALFTPTAQSSGNSSTIGLADLYI